MRSAEVVFLNQVGEKETAKQARVTQDVSGRTWVVLNDLKASLSVCLSVFACVLGVDLMIEVCVCQRIAC